MLNRLFPRLVRRYFAVVQWKLSKPSEVRKFYESKVLRNNFRNQARNVKALI